MSDQKINDDNVIHYDAVELVEFRDNMENSNLVNEPTSQTMEIDSDSTIIESSGDLQNLNNEHSQNRNINSQANCDPFCCNDVCQSCGWIMNQIKNVFINCVKDCCSGGGDCNC
jgi:hypothetical protein